MLIINVTLQYLANPYYIYRNENTWDPSEVFLNNWENLLLISFFFDVILHVIGFGCVFARNWTNIQEMLILVLFIFVIGHNSMDFSAHEQDFLAHKAVGIGLK